MSVIWVHASQVVKIPKLNRLSVHCVLSQLRGGVKEGNNSNNNSDGCLMNAVISDVIFPAFPLWVEHFSWQNPG